MRGMMSKTCYEGMPPEPRPPGPPPKPPPVPPDPIPPRVAGARLLEKGLKTLSFDVRAICLNAQSIRGGPRPSLEA